MQPGQLPRGYPLHGGATGMHDYSAFSGAPPGVLNAMVYGTSDEDWSVNRRTAATSAAATAAQQNPAAAAQVAQLYAPYMANYANSLQLQRGGDPRFFGFGAPNIFNSAAAGMGLDPYQSAEEFMVATRQAQQAAAVASASAVAASQSGRRTAEHKAAPTAPGATGPSAMSQAQVAVAAAQAAVRAQSSQAQTSHSAQAQQAAQTSIAQARAAAQQQAQESAAGGAAAADSVAAGGEDEEQERRQKEKYGLLGILPVIRMTNADLNMLALGMDLATLGLNLSSTTPLYPTFSSPWINPTDVKVGTPDGPGPFLPEFFLPHCYFTCPPKMKTDHLQKFHVETLFYMFFNMPKDMLQAYAAAELYNRGWKYNPKLQHWFFWHQEKQEEPGKWKRFDPMNWETRDCFEHVDQSAFLTEDDVRLSFNAPAAPQGSQPSPPPGPPPGPPPKAS
eukprot:TRINITY_DN6476_c0_g2_i2.p1 TRINITY_DN6476_c0_g2~~TRINITY_DN6476_c0_g2_i2.p1  ORF type:complete len:448 (-),score=132.50 TRINITY_DN6476_c0_g2_i2:161-1504(-)